MLKRQTNRNLLVIVGLLELTLTDSCPTSWFGIGCSSMCHCTNNAICELTTGECPPNVYCAKGYFGPGCQFADLLAEMGSFQNPKFLVDGDNSTCNPDPTATSVTVTLNYTSTISWFRIHTDVDMSNCSMSVRLDKQQCDSRRMYRVSENILDVTCDSPGLATQLLIKGSVVSHMCDLEISGGRNIALNQATTQSSIFHQNINGKSESRNAVDGNRDPDFHHGGCAHTSNTDNPPWWQITLNRPEKIRRIVIFNRDVLRFRMSGFKMDIYSTSATQSILTVTRKENDTAVYYINLPSSIDPVHKIIITKKTDPDTADNFLTLCEVELYKEIHCPPIKYGLECQFNCTCCKSRRCNPITGSCSQSHAENNRNFPSCPNCKRQCCGLSGKCQEGCVAGYMGSYCLKACPAGAYGENCAKNCSRFCTNVCNRVTGHCNCSSPNLAPPLCQDCTLRKFGANCTSPCPRLCGLNPCHRNIGVCNSCTGGRVGNFCESCVPGHYGPMCTVKCPPTCFNDTCHPLLGICYGCLEGHVGEFCTLELRESPLVLASVSMTALVIFTLFCYCLMTIKEGRAFYLYTRGESESEKTTIASSYFTESSESSV